MARSTEQHLSDWLSNDRRNERRPQPPYSKEPPQEQLILHGYDKGEDPSASRQQREIDEARRRLKDFDARIKAGTYPLRELPPTAAAAARATTRNKP